MEVEAADKFSLSGDLCQPPACSSHRWGTYFHLTLYQLCCLCPKMGPKLNNFGPPDSLLKHATAIWKIGVLTLSLLGILSDGGFFSLATVFWDHPTTGCVYTVCQATSPVLEHSFAGFPFFCPAVWLLFLLFSDFPRIRVWPEPRRRTGPLRALGSV